MGKYLAAIWIDQFDLMGIESGYDLIEVVKVLFAIAVLIAGLLSVFFIFYGGVVFILSSGDEEKIKKAIQTIRYAVVGLLVVILSASFVAIIGRIFGLDLVSYLAPGSIWAIINQLANKGTLNTIP